MPGLEKLTEQSLREFGLLGTIILLGLVYLVVLRWKQTPQPPSAMPLHAADEKLQLLPRIVEQLKLLPLVLEEARSLGRDLRESRVQMDHMEDRLERLETLSQIIKDRQSR